MSTLGAAPQTEGLLSAADIRATMAASNVVSGFSAAGSLFILICYARYTHLRKFAFTLVAILSFTDLLNQLTEFVQPGPAELDAIVASGVLSPTCYFQALTDTFFELSSVLWTSAIAFSLYLVVFLRIQDQGELYKRLPRIAAICYGVPLVATLLPLTEQAYGVAGAWCWIPGTARSWYWQWIVFYGPLLLALVFNTVVYIRTYLVLERTVKSVGEADASAKQLRAVMARLQYYPVVLAIVWTPALVNRILEASTGRQVLALYFAQKALSSSQGLLNAAVYGLSQGVREAIGQDLAVFFPRLFGGLTVAAIDRATTAVANPGTRRGESDKMPLQAPEMGGDDGGSTMDDLAVEMLGREEVVVPLPGPPGRVHSRRHDLTVRGSP
jgi:hypothetical protein